jgi:hypothetical protein
MCPHSGLRQQLCARSGWHLHVEVCRPGSQLVNVINRVGRVRCIGQFAFHPRCGHFLTEESGKNSRILNITRSTSPIVPSSVGARSNIDPLTSWGGGTPLHLPFLTHYSPSSPSSQSSSSGSLMQNTVRDSLPITFVTTSAMVTALPSAISTGISSSTPSSTSRRSPTLIGK